MSAPKIGDTWWRYEDFRTAPPTDECGYTCGPSTLHVRLREFRVTKVTPRGVKVTAVFGGFICSDEHFVCDDWTKKYAWPTKELAAESFRRRKEVLASMCRLRLKRAEEALRAAERIVDGVEVLEVEG